MNAAERAGADGTTAPASFGGEIVDTRLADAARPLIEKLVGNGVASRLAAGDPTLWGPDAESEAAKRLSWTSLHDTSTPLAVELAAA